MQSFASVLIACDHETENRKKFRPILMHGMCSRLDHYGVVPKEVRLSNGASGA